MKFQRQAVLRRTAIAASFAALFAGSQLAHADTITRSNVYVTGSWAQAPGTQNGQLQTVKTDYPTGSSNTTQWEVDTANTFDGNGNPISIKISTPSTTGTAFAARTTVTYTYDSAGQFPIKQTNALSQVTQRTFDPVIGNKLSETAPDGTVTTWQYDSFGRQILQQNPDGTQLATSYLYCSGTNGGTIPCPANAVYVTRISPLASDGVTQNGPTVSSYVDILARIVRTESLGFDGVSLIRVDTIYDNLGRIYQRSRPYYSGQTPQWTTYTYDTLNRLIGTALPDGTSTSASYSGATKVETNALNSTRTTVTNSQGQITQVTDAQGNTLTYKYNAAGLLTQTTDPNGNAVSTAYDILGHRTQTIDADMGTWSYSYDLLGNFLSQTDAKGNAVTNSYDLLNRVAKTTEPDLTSTFTFDSCTNGVGKLCSISSNNGYARSTTYDTLGRPSSVATTADTTYTSSKTYDSNGRVATQTYPGGVVLKYVYTGLGYLQQVQDNVSSVVYWQGNLRDAENHLVQQTYGNGIVTQFVYNTANGRLQNIYAGSGNALQNLSYGYDANGNLTARSDANQSLSETFLYDPLNRVTSNSVNSSGAGLYTQSYGYDGTGNITSRSDVGTYSYGAVNARPHAVTSVALATGGSMQYSYDTNGNQTGQVVKDAGGNVVSTAGRTGTYTSYNMPAGIVAPNASFTFTYGPDHKRVKMVGPNATTIYLNPNNTGGLFFEKDINTNGSVENRNFITADGKVIGIIKQDTVSGTTTTSVIYLHRDYLGSTTAVTDPGGNVLEQLGYEPFGKRRFVNGALDTSATIRALNTDRGYTNHEQLDSVGLINMNGRIFDPVIGRFVSADPKIPYPGQTQSYNRYAYTRNNPMIMFDPSGFDEEDIFGVDGYDGGGGGGGGGGEPNGGGSDDGSGGDGSGASDPPSPPQPCASDGTGDCTIHVTGSRIDDGGPDEIPVTLPPWSFGGGSVIISGTQSTNNNNNQCTASPNFSTIGGTNSDPAGSSFAATNRNMLRKGSDTYLVQRYSEAIELGVVNQNPGDINRSLIERRPALNQKWWQAAVPALVIGGGLLLYKDCLDRCTGGTTYCPTDQKSRNLFGICINYCTNLSSLWLTILDGGFGNTKPPFPVPTGTAGTVGGKAGGG